LGLFEFILRSTTTPATPTSTTAATNARPPRINLGENAGADGVLAALLAEDEAGGEVDSGEVTGSDSSRGAGGRTRGP
jgi:hypothetical protein